MIAEFCKKHSGYGAIQRLNQKLLTDKLSEEKMKIFLSSIWNFNFHIASGIPVLGGRMFEHLYPKAGFKSLTIASNVLKPSIDEFGLSSEKAVNHHELFWIFCEGLNFRKNDLENRFAVPASVELGSKMKEWYYDSDVPFALGVHLASETTSEAEFSGWYQVFEGKTYNIFGTRAFDYISCHIDKESAHVKQCEECLTSYLDVYPEKLERVQAGAIEYLEYYDRMIADIEGQIWN